MDDFELTPESDTGEDFNEEAALAEKQTIASDNAEFTLKYLGEEVKIDREKAVELAQKGMDYDRIRGRYERLKTTALNEGANPAGIKRADDIDGFLEDYPTVDPKDIPMEVWVEVKNGKSLSEAYMKWENSRLKDEAEASKQNFALKGVSTGSRDSSGKQNILDEFARELLG